ncbi:MAG: putative secreted protein [Labilithrix sp.]|nr:putative secreted protein [Labilithrix sp.]
MVHELKSLTAVVIVALPLGLVTVGCNPSGSAERTERWASTENTNVALNWDKVNEAYKLADGPEDLERRVNEIYDGSEVISISVADLDAKTQLVTGFFDKNTNGTVDDAEKIFTIRRELSGESTAQYQTVGYGPYYGYHSPFFSIATGMLMGSMMSRTFAPGYVPMYQQPYTTPSSRGADIRQTRSSYRAANPSQFQRSQSGRTYNRPMSTPRTTTGGSRGFGGGGKFGVATKGRAVRLDA